MIMAAIKKIPRNWILAGSLIVVSAVIGSALGKYEARTSGTTSTAGTPQLRKPDAAFVLPPAPPPPASTSEAAEKTETTVDLDSLRIWEATVRQPLPPRKEPLTPPDWKIVGVSASGNDKNVMILFENQTTAEVLKIGDKLPGGAKIVDITQDYLRLVLNGQYIKLNLREQ